ncbi:MAG: carboxylating nicotinate-nucleotide diphosphorylase [Acidimicrobiia bacterium]
MSPADYEPVIERALAEDLGTRGDVTSEAVIPERLTARARLMARAPGVVAGLEIAAAVFARVDADLRFEPSVSEGAEVRAGDVIASVSGRARSILTAERTALNVLGRMSGVATATRRLVEAVDGTAARISDTRKTMPGLRALDKYAVLMGGGLNHRMGLYDAVLIKDNHLAAVGDIAAAVGAARAAVGPEMMIEVEVDDLDQLAAVLATDADRVLLDNMDLDTMRRAVELVAGSMITEASGGVTEGTVRAIALTGVDVISTGWITHSAPQLDIALDFVPQARPSVPSPP